MNREELLAAIAPCGIDCVNCPVEERNVTPELQARIGVMLGLPPETIFCKGCRSDQKAPLCPETCATFVCSVSKGVDFCFACGEFPCSKFNPASDRADKLPHNLKVYNLCRMKMMGLERWLEEDACSTSFRYYRGKMVIGEGPKTGEE